MHEGFHFILVGELESLVGLQNNEDVVVVYERISSHGHAKVASRKFGADIVGAAEALFR